MPKSVKKFFNILPPTPENLELVNKYVLDHSNYDGYTRMAALLVSPLGRIQYKWNRLGHSGVSIFTFAGISGVPPKVIRKYFLEGGYVEPMLGRLDYCGATGLPVYAGTYSAGRGYPNLTKYPKAESTEKNFVKLFGGKDWKNYTHRAFRVPGKGGTISIAHWKELWQAYWLKPAPNPRTFQVRNFQREALAKKWKEAKEAEA